jgi:hypothetical protein
MPNVILLTSAEADVVRGPSAEAPARAALAPVALTDGRYILGAEVLDDPLHAEDHTFLAALPQADVAEIVALLPQPEHP